MTDDDHSSEIETVGIKPRQTRRKIRARLFIFMICLAISASMWVFIELMKDYTSDISYPITFIHVPESLILVNQADSVITVGVNAQGFELLVAQFVSKRHPVEIDLSELHIRQGKEGYSAFIPASQLLQQVGRQLSYSKSIIAIKPDTLFFRFSEIYRKRVPVVPDISYSFASQYQLYDSVRFSPQTVMVSSIKDVIDTIRFVSTERVRLKDLDSNLVISVPLRKGLRTNMIRYSSDSVTVKIQVQKYTEAVFSVPVTISGNTQPLRLFPDQVEISCLVPLNDYHLIETANFAAEVLATPSMLSAGKKLEVRLSRSPANIRSLRIKPDHVEFIIISK